MVVIASSLGGSVTIAPASGSAAIATKNRCISHIVIKEEQNGNIFSSTSTADDGGIGYHLCRCRTKPTTDMRVVQQLLQQDEETLLKSLVAFFWQPQHQPNKGTKVQYLGHWRFVELEIRQFVYQNHEQWGVMTVQFKR